MRTITFLLFLLSSFHVCSQTSFGVEFGKYFENYSGVNDLDSITVDINRSDFGEAFFGVFFEIPVTDRLALHSKLNARPIYTSTLVYNRQENCLFCPVVKASSMSVFSTSLELLPKFEIIKVGSAKLSLYGGGNLNFNFRIENPYTRFARGRHPGVATVINSLDKAVNPITFSWVYAASLEYGRIVLWAKVQHWSKFTDSIEVNDRKYNFDNRWAFVSFSIGYRFYSLKLKNKGDRSLKR